MLFIRRVYAELVVMISMLVHSFVILENNIGRGGDNWKMVMKLWNMSGFVSDGENSEKSARVMEIHMRTFSQTTILLVESSTKYSCGWVLAQEKEQNSHIPTIYTEVHSPPAFWLDDSKDDAHRRWPESYE